MVRNPYRRFWVNCVPHTWGMVASVASGSAWRRISETTETPLRIRWAARHACKRLRRRLAEVERERDELGSLVEDERDAANERIAKLEAEKRVMHARITNQRRELTTLQEQLRGVWKYHTDATRQRNAAQAQVAELRSALLPFAKAAEIIDDPALMGVSDRTQLCRIDETLTVADVRAARAALSNREEKP